MSGWVVLALNIGLVANSVGIVLLARAQSHTTTVLLELIETVETRP